MLLRLCCSGGGGDKGCWSLRRGLLRRRRKRSFFGGGRYVLAAGAIIDGGGSSFFRWGALTYFHGVSFGVSFVDEASSFFRMILFAGFAFRASFIISAFACSRRRRNDSVLSLSFLFLFLFFVIVCIRGRFRTSYVVLSVVVTVVCHFCRCGVGRLTHWAAYGR